MLVPEPFLKSINVPLSFLEPGLDLIQRWFETYESPKSRESAKKEGIRLLLWLASQNRGLADFTLEDALPYKRFLASPSPKKIWVGPKKSIGNDDLWRPFVGGLSEASSRTAFAYLRSFYKFLVTIKFINSNPFSDAKVKFRNVDCRSFQKRSFTPAARSQILGFFNTNPRGLDPKDLSRRKLLFFFAFHTGARRAEISEALFSDIQADKNGLYWWHVVGKGGKASQVPVGEELLELVIEHLACIGIKMPSLATHRFPNIPLISTVSSTDSKMSAHRVWSLFKETASMIADEASASGDLDSAAELRLASTHWLRHSAGSFQLSELGLTLAEVRDNLRHASIATTSLYVDSEDRVRHDKVRKASF